MGRKRKETTIGAVMFTYVGTHEDFNKFLKAVVHDYFRVGNLPVHRGDNPVEKVEKTVA